MKNYSLKKDILFMVLLSIACAFVLGATRYAVGPRTEISEEAVKAILTIQKQTFDETKMYKCFFETFENIQKGRISIWQNKTNRSILACEATGSGMWSEIVLVFVYDSFAKKIIGLKVTDQKETAGLGSKISDEDFINQFSDLEVNKTVKVDAITGATTSSKSVELLINKALVICQNLI